MTNQPNRLPAEGEHSFAGAEIERAKPLSFRLNGHAIEGFAGDTVLSAALASGYVEAGRRGGMPYALDERFAPSVVAVGVGENARTTLPMDRTPAANGMDLVTLPAHIVPARGANAAFRRLAFGPPRSLGADLDKQVALAGPWVDMAPAELFETDLCVIGGGVAGMSAAIAAGNAGERVLVVERRQWLGGDARYFGSIEGEESPELTLARLSADLAELPNVVVMLTAEALSIGDGIVRIHHVDTSEGYAQSRVIGISTSRVVLATGTVERLPVFAGNRLPGVVTSAAAFHRASRHGVWIGQTALLNAASSVAYRLATRAIDAGVKMVRLTDNRGQPRSRFIEFAKAYGITLLRDVTPISAEPRRARPFAAPVLSVRLVEQFGDRTRDLEPIEADSFVVSGGWQPELRLWLTSGGHCRWSDDTNRLEATGAIEGIVLAGSAAGYETLTACVASGAAAAAHAFGRPQADIADRRIDPIYETRDGPPAVGPETSSRYPTLLDAGTSLNQRPAMRRAGLVERLVPGGGAVNPLADQPHAMSIGDIAAAVQLGLVAREDAGGLAEERCLVGVPVIDAGPALRFPDPQTAPDAIPAYLAGRFGRSPQVWVIAAADRRSFEPGSLIHANSDGTDAFRAIGVVLGAATGGETLAVLADEPVSGAMAVVRVGDTATPVTLVSRYAPPAREVQVAEPSDEPAPAPEPASDPGPVAAVAAGAVLAAELAIAADADSSAAGSDETTGDDRDDADAPSPGAGHGEPEESGPPNDAAGGEDDGDQGEGAEADGAEGASQ